MPLIGSSAITPTSGIGPKGPTGATGPSGPRGASGNTGATGPTGPTGTYVASSYFNLNDPNLYLVLSEIILIAQWLVLMPYLLLPEIL